MLDKKERLKKRVSGITTKPITLKPLDRLEQHLISLQNSLKPLNDKMSAIETQISEKRHSLLLPPLDSELTRNIHSSGMLNPQLNKRMIVSSSEPSLRDSLVWKSNYVAYPRRRFVSTSSNENTFISIGTWADKQSREFDFKSLLENDTYQYKRFPKLKNDRRPIWH